METHGMKFIVDTNGVAKGFREYRSAVEGIFNSLDKFEAHVSKTMKNVGKAAGNKQNLNSFKRAIDAYGNINVDPNAARKLNTLSKAMQGFKAPSPAQTKRTKAFFTSLSKLPDLSSAYRSIKMMSDMKAAMAGFQAPSASQSKRLREFAQAANSSVAGLNNLGKIRGLSSAAYEVNAFSAALKNVKAPSASQITNLGNLALAFRSFNFNNLKASGNFYAALGAISNFKAPSKAQITNLSTFVSAVGAMRVPQNADKVAAALYKIASAANLAGTALRGLRAGTGSLGSSMGHLGSQTRRASLQMMGLQNAFSGTFQIGSALRSLLGSLTIAELGRNFFEATNAAIQFKAQMSVVNRDLAFADAQLGYINETANKFGLNMLTAETGFAKLSIAASKSGMTVMQTREAFEGFSTAMTVLGTTTDRQNDVWLAVQQVLNKGYLSAEELNQQLNEHLPGAMAYAAEYADKLGMSLEKGLKTKAIEANEVLGYMAKRFKEDFGPAMEQALNRPNTQMQILKNNFNLLFQAIGEAGGNEAFANLLRSVNERMRPEDIERYARAIGDSLAQAVDKVAVAFDWLYENWDKIKGPLATTLDLMGRWMVVSGSLQIMRYIVTPLTLIGPALGGLKAASTLMGVAFAGNLGTAAAATSTLSGATGVLATRILIMRNAVMANVTAMRAAAASQGIFAAASVGLTGAVSGLKATVQALWASFGPLGLVLTATAGILYGIYSAVSDVNEVIDTSTRFHDKYRSTVDSAMKSVGLFTTASENGSVAVNMMNSATEAANSLSDIHKQKLDAETGGYYSLATAAIAAARAKLMAQDAELDSRITKARASSVDDLGAKYQKQKEEGSFLDAAGTAWTRGVLKWENLFNSGNTQKKVRNEISTLLAAKSELAANIKKVDELDPMKLAEQMQTTAAPSVNRTSKDESNSGSASKRASELNKLTNAVDALMKNLTDGDPIGKMYADFVKTLTSEAQTLLNDNGYKQFIKNISAEAENGKVTVQSLIDALQNGNLDGKIMADLKNRYGESVTGIIDMLKAQQAAFEEAVKEKIIKDLDTKFKAVRSVMQEFGEFVPKLQAANDNIEGLTRLGKIALPLDQFTDWVTGLRSGTLETDAAVDQLVASINNPALRSNQLSEAMKAGKVEAEEMTNAVRMMTNATEARRKDAEEELVFGKRLLRLRSEEIMLNGMSARDASLMKTLQDEVNAARERGITLTDEKIAKLKQELYVQQALADQMQRNKEFFENNGIRSYINDVADAGAAINELDKNVLQSLEDQLFSLGTTGEFSFNAIFDTIQQGIVRFSSQQITKSLMEGLFSQDELDGGTPSLMGPLFEAIGLGQYKPDESMPLGSKMNPMYVQFANGVGVGTDGRLTAESNPVAEMLGTAANDNGLTTATTPGVTQDPITKATEATATSFSDTMTSMMPMVGMAFASSFKSPIAQIGVMFATMMITKMLSSQGGGAGGGMGGIGGLFSMFGAFKEGGISGSPVGYASAPASAFANAPHYSEGTANTSGIPAVLHDNEAVIPLSRNRKVPVEIAGGGGGTVVNNNFNVTTPDANSFRKSRQQIATDMHMQAAKAYRRNHG